MTGTGTAPSSRTRPPAAWSCVLTVPLESIIESTGLTQMRLLFGSAIRKVDREQPDPYCTGSNPRSANTFFATNVAFSARGKPQ